MNLSSPQPVACSPSDVAVPQDSKRILLIEDDSDIAALLHRHLSESGAHVEHVSSGESGLARIEADNWDLVILDLGLPGIDGIEVAATIKRLRPSLPIMVVTARSSEADLVGGLDAGADDYVIKPFSMLELVARVRAVFRRLDNQQAQLNHQVLVAGDLTLDVETHAVVINGRSISLTAREFGLLGEFVAHPGKVFRRGELLERVWGTQYEGYRHTVNTHINRLRSKIELDPHDPQYIQTVWGVGYKLKN